MEARLRSRHEKLVKSHMSVNSALTHGVKSTLSEEVSFSQTQAAWRFFNNENCTLKKLSEPLLEAASELSQQECAQYCLVAHDWSHLGFNSHSDKVDTYNVFKKCIGYDLQSSLLLSDKHGGPLAPLASNLKTKKELLSSYGSPRRNLTNLEELAERIKWIEGLALDKPRVHIVDREADSVELFRKLKNSYWLIRVNGGHSAESDGVKKAIQKHSENLVYQESRSVLYKGKKATQLIAETKISITRPAQPKKKDKNLKRVAPIPGEPVNVRLIVSKIVDKTGNELAIWYLLSNVKEDVLAATLALWYYWRWSIESHFKLLKSAGMQLESWQQKTPMALMRRLMVASMACVCVWRIANRKGPEATDLRKLLVRLSGRQMKWKVAFTHSALLAGLWSLINMQHLIEEIGVEGIKSQIKELQQCIGFV